jgi:hypothetical protein
MSNVLITMLTLGKQEWIVILDGVKNGQSDATAVNLSFSLTLLESKVKAWFSLLWLLGSLRLTTVVCSSQTRGWPWVG